MVWATAISSFLLGLLVYAVTIALLGEYQDTKRRKIQAAKDSEDRIWKRVYACDDAIQRLNDQLSGHRERIFKLEYRLHNR